MSHHAYRLLCGLLATCCSIEPLRAGEVLFRFDDTFDLASAAASDVKLSRSDDALRLETGHNVDWPGITLEAPQQRWDLSAFAYVAVELENVGSGAVEVCCRLDNPGADGSRNCLTGRIALEPGEQKTLRVALDKRLPRPLQGKLFGMRGYPGGSNQRGGIDTANVTQLLIFVPKPRADHVFEIGSIRAGGSAPQAVSLDEKDFFPMIDTFGQYVHRDWPGKTKSIEDLHARQKEEAADLAARPGPHGWNQFGAWKAGPKLEASGRFRVEKHRGKWWLVDPEGRLFWSHGIDCVRPNNATTPITDREHYFAELPGPDSPAAQFYGRAAWAPHGYYQGKNGYRTFNFTAVNLLRKFARQWQSRSAELAHRRLRSWGMNTIANWSDPEIYLARKTPYVATIHFRAGPIEGSQGYWDKFPDVFDPGFAEALHERMAAEKGKAAGDPWCVGYFVGNELSWGDETSLAVAALASPAEQPAKRAFLDDLKTKYRTTEQLNRAWGTTHDSWNALLASTTPPDRQKAHHDLAAFYTRAAEQYFRICREGIKQVDPAGLYLGCRFAWVNDRAVRAAAKYCDVVSFNRYRRSVADFRLPDGVDKPVVIGEFHFGALDRGMFHTGLVKTANQQERAEAYRAYVQGALANPCIVGTHWFQYGDQATTGRGDGENYQIGFLDVCDTPYAETVAACREVGYKMYAYRAGWK